MSNAADSILINDENKRNSYKINVIQNIEIEKKETKKDNNNNSNFPIIKSKSIKNKMRIKQLLESSFKDKRSSRNSSIEQKNNSLFFQSKNSVNKEFNQSKIFYGQSMSPVQKRRKIYDNNSNCNLDLMKLASQIYGKEEHFNKYITAHNNFENEQKNKENMPKVNRIKSNQKICRYEKVSAMKLPNNSKKPIQSSKIISKFYSQSRFNKKENKSIVILDNSDKKEQKVQKERKDKKEEKKNNNIEKNKEKKITSKTLNILDKKGNNNDINNIKNVIKNIKKDDINVIEIKKIKNEFKQTKCINILKCHLLCCINTDGL